MPQDFTTVEGTALLCFPPTDAVFAAHARRLLERLGTSEPAALEAALRGLYSSAVVREREALASFGQRAWYVYRDGSHSPFVEGEPWWGRPETARVVIGPDGCYVGANEPALALMGVTREELLTARSGDFTTPEHREVVPWLLDLLRSTGELHSTSVLCPRDGRPEHPVEFHLERDPEDPLRIVSWFRPIDPSAIE